MSRTLKMCLFHRVSAFQIMLQTQYRALHRGQHWPHVFDCLAMAEKPWGNITFAENSKWSRNTTSAGRTDGHRPVLPTVCPSSVGCGSMWRRLHQEALRQSPCWCVSVLFLHLFLLLHGHRSSATSIMHIKSHPQVKHQRPHTHWWFHRHSIPPSRRGSIDTTRRLDTPVSYLSWLLLTL